MEGMKMSLESAIKAVVGFLWGWPLILYLVGTGLFFTFRSGFWQFRHFGYALKYFYAGTFKKGEAKGAAGILSSSQALAITLAATVGAGNIGGVASAIALGGPGALFWMWVTALVGMATKMAEVGLALYYRSVKPNGEAYGGPPYYMERGFKDKFGEKGYKIGKILAVLFCIAFLGDVIFGMSTYTVSEAINTVFGFNKIIVAILFAILVTIVVLGGLRRLASVCSVAVPFMALFYIIGGLYIILMNASEIPTAFALIFKHAFTPMAAIGGFGGASFILTLRTGIARGLYSNEAGWGSSPLVHASAKVDHPIKQSIYGLVEVFVDTIIICSITGLVIVTTGAWKTGLSGSELTLHAFSSNIGFWGSAVVAISLFLFAWTTTLGWYGYQEGNVRYIFAFNEKLQSVAVKIFRRIFVLPQLFLAIVAIVHGLPASVFWLFADISSALPTYINLFAILVLSGKYIELLHDYNSRVLGYRIDGAKASKLFYTDNNLP